MQGVHMPDLEYSYFSRAMSAANLQEKITIWTAQRYIKISTLNCLCPPFQPTTDRILDSITTDVVPVGNHLYPTGTTTLG